MYIVEGWQSQSHWECDVHDVDSSLNLDLIVDVFTLGLIVDMLSEPLKWPQNESKSTMISFCCIYVKAP